MQFILSHSYFLFSHYVLPKILNGSQKSVQLHYYSTQQICFILENRENFIPFILYHWCSFSMLSHNLHCPSLLFMTDKIIVSQNSYLITISVTCSKFEHNVPGFAQIIFFVELSTIQPYTISYRKCMFGNKHMKKSFTNALILSLLFYHCVRWHCRRVLMTCLRIPQGHIRLT